MYMRFVCPDCGDAHDEPGDAGLGCRIRCLDCQVEVDLALEIALIVIEHPAAA